MDSAPVFIAAAVAATIAYLGVCYVLRNAAATGLLDIPNERSSHETPVPRGGGLGIVVGVVVGIVVLYFAGRLPLEPLLAVFGGALLIGGIGLADDRRDISARARIVVHFTAAAWALYWIADWSIAGGMAVATSILAVSFAIGIVWALNLYNFMDGIDGIALQEAIFISLSGSILLWRTGSPWLGILICLAVSSVVVLFWNWEPARIFLGDVGSGFMGFILAVIAIGTHDEVSLITWSILWGVFVVDATATLLTRMVTGQRWYSAHRSHAYQRLARKAGSHSVISSGAFLVNLAWLLPWAYLAHYEVLPPVVCLAVALLPLTAAAIAVGAGRPNSGQ